MSMAIGNSNDTATPNTRRHPPGLYVLFFTEMWERFAYYGMRALLMYYMTKCIFLPETSPAVWGYEPFKHALEWVFRRAFGIQELASQTYGLYTAFVYLTPFFGGIIADRWLGQRKSVLIGGVLMATAEFMLMSKSLFFPALLLLILGNGMFKPNISTQVGNLYPHGDPRRDRAFSIFYMGINLGAFFSPLICGTIGEKYGWNYGFGAAGVGMVCGLLLYLWGQRYLASDNIMRQAAASSGAVAHAPLTSAEKKRIGALVVLCALTICFWATYEQQGNTLALWADTQTNRHILGPDSWEVPATWFQSVNPFLIFILTPIITTFWAWQSRRKKEPSSIAKMSLACLMLSVSYLIMIPAALASSRAANGQVSMWWLVGNIFVMTLGELYLSPVGLSLITKVAPARMVSMMMGVWFLSSFAGNYLCGFLGTFWNKMPKEAFFLLLAVLTAATGLGIFLVLKPLKRALHSEHAPMDI